MKKIAAFIINEIVIVGLCLAQGTPDSTNFQAGWGTLNYSVPESPAFKILGTSPDNIMKPTSTRDIAVAVGNYFVNNGATIPNNLAIEIAPSLFNPSVSLSDYQKSLTRIFYTSTFSIGTAKDANGGSLLSVGLKMKLVDGADLRTNIAFNKFISDQHNYYSDAFEQAIDEEASKQATLKHEKTTTAEVEVTIAFQDTTNPDHGKIYDDVMKKIGEKVDVNKISNYRNAVKDSLWNATTWDLGVAALFSSKDTLIKNFSGPSKVGLWTALGLPIGSLSQILLGLNVLVSDDTTGNDGAGKLTQLSCDVGARIYYGRNDDKGYFQVEADAQHSVLPAYKIGVGIETTLSGGIWFDCTLGLQKTGSQSAVFAPNLNISFAPPEKN